MKIVNLDAYTIHMNDLTWDDLEKLGDLTTYERTAQKDAAKVIGDAEAILSSKVHITKDIMDECPNLKFICATATGYDHIDISYAKEKGIAVCNIPAYSTESVAQHTFALILELVNHVGIHNRSVQDGNWAKSKDFCFNEKPISQLSDMSLGIIGYGNIGKRVAEIANVFGMQINIYSKNPEETIKSDIITLHCPLKDNTREMINKDFIEKMKDKAMIVNTARGGLINELDLANAVKSGKLSAAAIDVLTQEPPTKPSPLLGVENIIVTPHVAWTSKQARSTITKTSAANLKSFLEGGTLNRIV